LNTSSFVHDQISGRRLTGVTFVMDYVQLQFDPPPTINALTPITVRSAGRVVVSGDDQFRNLLCEQIPKVVAAVSLREGEALDLVLLDGSVISLSLKPADYVGPEALIIWQR
jgi:hypothetical protein